MKTLTKIKLINWHGFYDETIDISGSVLVTGENGTGKSTFLDAIYFVLTGGEENFNSAANTNNSRTIETYMRGKTGIEGNAYLRNDRNLLSHIALEYFDCIRKESFVIGVVLEILDGKTKIDRSFYHIPNSKLFDELFVSDEQYLNFHQMKKRNQSLTINELKTGGKSGIRKDIYQILEMDVSNDRYFQLLPKAIAFRPIGEHGKDVSDFVYDFLMPESKIDLNHIKTTINSYNEIRRQLENEKNKRNELNIICSLGDEYNSCCTEEEILNGYKNILNLTSYEQSYSKCESEETKNSVALEEVDNKKIFLLSQQNDINEKIQLISNDDTYRTINDLRNKMNKLKEELKSKEEEKNKFNKLIIDEMNDVGTFIKSEINLGKYIKSEDYPGFKSDLKNYINFVKSQIESAIEERYKVSEKKNSLIIKEKELSNRQSKLSNGCFEYSYEVTKLISLIKDECLKKYNKEVIPTPFCELIEIEKCYEKEQNIIEGYLGNRRFDLFVPEEYFDFSKAVYEKHKSKYNIFNVGLVNSDKLPFVTPKDNSLAKMIKTDNAKASKYVNVLLGNILFSNGEVLSDDQSHIDISGFVYENYSYNQINNEISKEPFIGIESIKTQLKNVENQLQELQKTLNELLNREVDINVRISKLQKSRYAELDTKGNLWETYNNTNNKYVLMDREYNSMIMNHGLTKDFTDLTNNLNQIKDEIKEIEQKRDDLVKKSQNIENDKRTLLEKIEIVKKNLSKYYSDPIFKNSVDEYMNKHNFSLSTIDKYIETNNNKKSQSKNNLLPRMSKYILDFSFDATVSIESLPTFYNELNTIVSRNLANYEGKIEEAQKEATYIFENSYIEEIRENINREKRNIDELNKVLKERPFGSDEEIYQFIIFKSKDNNFGQYYDILNSGQSFNCSNLFTENLDDKNKALMQELFLKLTADVKDVNQEKLVSEYTDYRKFMSYDIKISNKNGKDSYFSKIYKEKSGGETQTPFYVVIAASFDQIVKGGFKVRSPGCLVMFDEAFNNMDESRIESMMKYFNELSIQSIIAVPTARAKSIFPYVGTSIVLIKENGRIASVEWKNDNISD